MNHSAIDHAVMAYSARQLRRLVRIGPKVSYVGLLSRAGDGRGYFAPIGAEFEADANGWVANLLAGEPAAALACAPPAVIRFCA